MKATAVPSSRSCGAQADGAGGHRATRSAGAVHVASRWWLRLLLYMLLGTAIIIIWSDRLPDWMELGIERFQVRKMIRNGGGWAALQRDCNALATKYKDDSFGFRWYKNGPPDDTNSLPTAIAALNPMMVEFLSPKMMQGLGAGGGTNLVVRISIFGHHTTGRHEKPWLGLDVLCGSSVTNYSSVDPHPFAPNSWNWQYRKIVDGIYEHYCIMH